MQLSTIATAINAKLVGVDATCNQVMIDTRKLVPQALFVAIKGAQVDGHDYVLAAQQMGAAAVLVNETCNTPLSIPKLIVTDTIQALGKLAQFWRAQFNIPIIGITGSCGKTTVKELVASICQQQGNTLFNAGNFNNHLGLPLTLLQLNATHQFAVLEMGANQVGDIAYLCHIAQPTITLVNNVHPAHLAGFGSLENIANTKGEIYTQLAQEGIAIINQEEPFAKQWANSLSKQSVITFGLANTNQVWASNITQNPTLGFTLHIQNKSYPLQLPWLGQHMVMNSLAAASVGVALGLSAKQIIAGLTQFSGVPNRLERQQVGDLIIIDDTYNANPGSMQAALQALATQPNERWLIMGDMAELGPEAIVYHQQIGQQAKALGIQQLWATGVLSEHAVEAFGTNGRYYANQSDLIKALKQVAPKATLLIKGSRSAKMELVTQALLAGEA